MRSAHSVASPSRCAGPPGRDAARSAREPVVHRDTFSSCARPAEVKWGLACGFAYACPANMPGDGGLNATDVGCSSDMPASRRPDGISQHNVTVLQHSVLRINTCMLTTVYRGRLELGQAFARRWPRAGPATCWW